MTPTEPERGPSGARLILNGGSSTLKFALYRDGVRCLRGTLERIGGDPQLRLGQAPAGLVPPATLTAPDTPTAAASLLDWLDAQGALAGVAAIIHRIVHGGRDFAAPAVLDATTLERLDALSPLAPLHQPQALAVVRACQRRLPGIRQIGCFDTAFHRDQPRLHQLFALPRALGDEGILRYGFHGLSYAHIARRLREREGEDAGGRAIVAHLGQGASLCAMHRGQSLATTMGFTALDGLMMGRRCGALDPGVLLYLQRQRGWDLERIERLLYQESGLLGVSGRSDDMRDLLASDDPACREAVDLFVHRLVREIGALVAVLGGLDTLVFTAGIGEHAAPIRQRVCEQLAWLGIALEPRRNSEHGPRLDRGEGPRLWVLATDEEAEMYLATRALLDA
ncbi:acetate/propionate family kinase [Halomonas sp. 328]|uniref:acetate/propionate family kinase n=1 Tax=Halomonas sp. 328 TaxID=2776704 RepID=UPI0018A75C0A|nr:acetate/propionate family kinase [Halomonas sp. 328]MBF8222066.1 acetate/propionate family kinase [Halomonas sp. 328]